MKKYSVVAECVIEAENEDEAIDIFKMGIRDLIDVVFSVREVKEELNE